ncbi:hypothetical protein A4X13_0g5770 [Tilletia indica]|uniref:ATP-dependent DNA helicase n=1 Tax=Tilletia indica TaxID=43049 RepID=A0A8T8SR71_9BASI|nr:hypothetical protein A4X13_0g5770 [Tilletia indica]
MPSSLSAVSSVVPSDVGPNIAPVQQIRTPYLRTQAIHHCPNQGAARMNRAELIRLLMTTMVNDEAKAIQSFLRRHVGDLNTAAAPRLGAIHRQMQLTYDATLMRAYLQSSERNANAIISSFDQRDSNGTTAKTVADIRNAPTVRCPGPGDNTILPELPKWPQIPSASLKDDCAREFRTGTCIALGPTCAVCSRRTFTKDLLFTKEHYTCKTVETSSIPVHLLKVSDNHLLSRPGNHFSFGHASIEGCALDKNGVHVTDNKAALDICDECHRLLSKTPPKLPPLSLANNNVRGWMPPGLQDVTWFEERLCARFLASAYVVRLYDLSAPGAPEHRPRTMKGHCCAFPLHTVSTASKLPWAVGDGSAMVTCLVIGPRTPRLEDLRHVFRVRRQKVIDLFNFLSDNFLDYPRVSINKAALKELPDDDVPELMMRHIVHQSHDKVPSLFDAETSGVEKHLGLGPDGDDASNARTFLEHHGLLDVNGVTVPAHIRAATALANATRTERPDLIIKHGSAFIQDYNNPSLFPGLFPTLFPWGTGGFESDRAVSLSFDRQAAHLLDLCDGAFRQHWLYIFVVGNIKQRRAIHLGSHLACKSRDYAKCAQDLKALNPALVKMISQHVADGGALDSLTPDEAKIFLLLRKCELVSTHVQGSKAAMNRARADIRAYISKFGIFQLFLTLNPSPVHSPVFQVFYGDRSMELDTSTITLPPAAERAARVADDPVAASDFFHFHVAAVFEFLFGWNVRSRTSKPEGGILGRLAAFFMVKEHTMRGQLHGHILIWLEGGLNPSDLRTHLRSDKTFRERYLAFMDDIISHHIPSSDAMDIAEEHDHEKELRYPRQERPPDVDSDSYKETFTRDHVLLGEEVQRHRCQPTCYKGGRNSCRFLFPHDVVPNTIFDAETNSVLLRTLDPTINWHNPTLLVSTRHNHDLKSVQSGRSGIAAASYITSYATKSDETPVNQINMINTVFQRMDALQEGNDDLKKLLSKCVMQFGRERQLHAKQVATYVRDLTDVWSSHKTVPMLSGKMIALAQSKYGLVSQEDEHNVGANLVPHDGTADPPSNPAPHDGAPAPVHDEVHVAPDDFDADGEDESLITLSFGGRANQTDDYFYRGSTLQDLPFFDFVRYCKLSKKPKKMNRNHHHLHPSHPNFATHCHSYIPTRSLGIPRAIFTKLPRPDGTDTLGEAYCCSMLVHFKPFGITNPLKSRQHTYSQIFSDFAFSTEALTIMRNWLAMFECEDARDADQLLRRKREARRNEEEDTQHLSHLLPDGPNTDLDMESFGNARGTSRATDEYTTALSTCGWFGHSATPESQGAIVATLGSHVQPCPTFTHHRRKKWSKEIKELEQRKHASSAAPQATTGILARDLGNELSSMFEPSTSAGNEISFSSSAVIPPSTIRLHSPTASMENLIQDLAKERNLNASQHLAFKVVATSFFNELQGVEQQPLRLLMHGAAGTGKTVVVRLLRELLERYGKGKEMIFMAPTGKAAAAIGGSTQHSAFSLPVHKRSITSEELLADARQELSTKKIVHLQNTFRDIRWVFFDEVSMTSAEMLADMDQALRVGKQNLDEVFGGVHVLFAGDLCQLPPVGAAPLYRMTTTGSGSAEQRSKNELGRAAWLHIDTVVEFEQQMRMTDSAMAQTLQRLRLRRCVSGDADLLNRNVIRSPTHPQGVLLGDRPGTIVLARTNETVRILNHKKATSEGLLNTGFVTMSHAQDQSSIVMTQKQRETLFAYNGTPQSRTCLGRIPLFIGMPVVFRGGNKSVILGVTNGAFATVAGFDTHKDRAGTTVAKGVLLRFDGLEQLQLSDLPIGTYPILTSQQSFNFKHGEGADAPVARVTRTQLPIQPGFAMTVHSAQGITAPNGVVVDLRCGGFEAYVAASRATRAADLFLIAPVTRSNLNTPALPYSLIQELKRLESLATTTKIKYDSREGDSADKSKRQRDTCDESDTARCSKRRRSISSSNFAPSAEGADTNSVSSAAAPPGFPTPSPYSHAD